MNIEEFSQLWTSPAGTYVLERFHVEGEEVLLIYCPKEESVFHIDDDGLQAAVVQRMIEAGIDIVDG